MTMLRVPRLNSNHIKALQTLVRLAFVRIVRGSLEDFRAKPEAPVATTLLEIMEYTDRLLEAEQPLTAAEALMSIHGGTEAMFPLDDIRFKFYEDIANLNISGLDFPTIQDAELQAYLGPLKALQAELQTLFASAPFVDKDTLLEDLKEPYSGTPSSFMN